MTLKDTAVRQSMRIADQIGKRYYPNQKPLLDELRRRDEYAIVVFDALRYDVAADILPQYLQGSLSPIWSAAHDTFEYGRLCWGDDVYQTTYCSGAVPLNSRDTVNHDEFNSLYEGFRPGEHLPNLVDAWETAWNRSLGTVSPEQLSELALDYIDRNELVVHYQQPHAPYIGRASILGHTNSRNAEPLTGEPVDGPVWERVKHGEISPADLQTAYRANVHRAVQAALPVFRELCAQDRTVIVTADHGELLAQYHPRLVSHPRMSFPQIRRVPWMSVEGVREFPAEIEDKNADAGSVAERLEALGYTEGRQSV
jgi:hypothetical protein